MEGTLLLLFAALPGMLVYANLVHLEIIDIGNESGFHLVRFVWAQLITFAMMWGMIAVGIHFPSRQAMKIQPAEVLHEE